MFERFKFSIFSKSKAEAKQPVNKDAEALGGKKIPAPPSAKQLSPLEKEQRLTGRVTPPPPVPELSPIQKEKKMKGRIAPPPPPEVPSKI